MCKVLPILLLLGLAGGLAYYFLTKNKVITNQPNIQLPTMEDFRREAPWNATSPSTAQRWPNNGHGLALTILNALDSKWYSYFDAAISDWDSGMDGIDPLTLTTKVVTVDSTCSPETGYQKVCNGDYGDNGWNGINTILTSGSSSLIIVSSAARMNEYYLNHGSDALKQYTMCHEIGHGFGLPHTDEKFWNRDLGNCLDYTMFPQDNLHPDLGLFEFLEALYGNTNGTSNVTWVGGGSSGSGSGSGSGGSGTGDDATVQAQSDTTSSSSSSGQNREITGTGTETATAGDGTTGTTEGIPSWVKDAWDSVTKEFVNYGSHTASENSGWRLLHSRGNLRSHQIDIGQGYSIIVNVVLADGYEERLRHY